MNANGNNITVKDLMDAFASLSPEDRNNFVAMAKKANTRTAALEALFAGGIKFAALSKNLEEGLEGHIPNNPKDVYYDDKIKKWTSKKDALEVASNSLKENGYSKGIIAGLTNAFFERAKKIADHCKLIKEGKRGTILQPYWFIAKRFGEDYKTNLQLKKMLADLNRAEKHATKLENMRANITSRESELTEDDTKFFDGIEEKFPENFENKNDYITAEGIPEADLNEILAQQEEIDPTKPVGQEVKDATSKEAKGQITGESAGEEKYNPSIKGTAASGEGGPSATRDIPGGSLVPYAGIKESNIEPVKESVKEEEPIPQASEQKTKPKEEIKVNADNIDETISSIRTKAGEAAAEAAAEAVAPIVEEIVKQKEELKSKKQELEDGQQKLKVEQQKLKDQQIKYIDEKGAWDQEMRSTRAEVAQAQLIIKQANAIRQDLSQYGMTIEQVLAVINAMKKVPDVASQDETLNQNGYVKTGP